MASRAPDRLPVTGRVDAAGQLLAADPPLERLQRDAGGEIGERLLIPQLAMLARQALRLGVPLSRSLVAAGPDCDLDLMVRAEPNEGEVLLKITRWASRQPAPPRLALVAVNASRDVPEPPAPPPPAEFELDAQLRLRSINSSARAWIDVDDDQAIGQPLTRLLRMLPDDQGEFALLDALADHHDFAVQRATPRRQTEAAPRRFAGTALYGPDGRFDGFRLTASSEAPPLTAVDDRVVIDPALDRALSSPLDRIITAADRIAQRSDGPLRNDYASYASDIAAAGRHLLSVIRSMSGGNAADNGAAQPVALVDLAADAVALVQPQAEARGVTIELDRPEARFDALAERRGAVQILVNILGNAVRHSPDGGRVELSLARAGAAVALTIADHGPGIEPADQARIFDRYERVDGSSDGGTGLGLAIARRLARSMGGDISLDSAAGEGARFTLTLPAA